jgi:predicted MFS family arabinose efflux permease
VLTYAMGSWVASRWGWRTGFMVAGMPGLLLALAVWTTFREPLRGATDDGGADGSAASGKIADGGHAEAGPASLKDTLRRMRAIAPVRWMLGALTATSVASVGLSTFMLSFLIRSHHLSLTRAGALIALGHVFSAMTIAIVGRIADRLSVRDERWTVWLPALIAGVGMPLTLVLTLSDAPLVVYLSLPLVSAIAGSQYGPVFAFLQNQMRPGMRATTMSIAYVIQNLVGIGLGSLLVGILSDGLRAGFGAESLRYAMACISVMYTVAAVCYLRAARTLNVSQALREAPAA